MSGAATGRVVSANAMQSLAATILGFHQGIEACRHPEDRQLATGYLAALGPLLARAVTGAELAGELTALERLFGNTWLKDPAPFAAAFTKWQQFKSEYEAGAELA